MTKIPFLRWTSDPAGDIKRGWSGHLQAWYGSEEEAIKDYQKRTAQGNYLPNEPKQDPATGEWNSEPESGLSGFGFEDEESFEHAMNEAKEISWFHQESRGQDLCLFVGTRLVEQGFDGEDLFVDAKFIAAIDVDNTYEEIQQALKQLKEIRYIIRQALLERFNFNNNKTFFPPENVKATARKALSMAGQASHGGNEGSGKRKAQELASGQQQSHAQMKRLKAFFDANQPGSPEWELHGGNDAKNWVEQALSTTHDSNMRTKEHMRRVGGTGYGGNEGMGSMDSNMMSTNNTRNHSVWTRMKNRGQNMQESEIDDDGNLKNFNSPERDIRNFHRRFSDFLKTKIGDEVNGFVLSHELEDVDWRTENGEYAIDTYFFPSPYFKPELQFTLFKKLDAPEGDMEVGDWKDLYQKSIPISIETLSNSADLDDIYYFLRLELSKFIDIFKDKINLNEAFIDDDGNLQQFQSDEQERKEDINQFKTEFGMFMYNEAKSGFEVNGFKLVPDEDAYGYFTWVSNLKDEYFIETFLFPYPDEKPLLAMTLVEEMETGERRKVEEKIVKIPDTVELHGSPGEMIEFLTKHLSKYIDDVTRRGKLMGL